MNLKVGHKLALGFGAAVLLAMALTGFLMLRLSEAMRVSLGVVANDLVVAETARDITQYQAELRIMRENAINEARLAKAEGRAFASVGVLERYRDRSRLAQQATEQMVKHTSERAETATYEERRRVWVDAAAISRDLAASLGRASELGASILERLERGAIDEALADRGRLDDLRADADNKLEMFETIGRRLGDGGRLALDGIYTETLRAVAAAAVIMLVAVIMIGVTISRALTQRIGQASGFVAQVGQGDLTRTVDIRGGDELAILGRRLNDMAGNLRSVAQTTRGAAENVHAATAQIRASTQQQAASVAQQLAAVEETTATLSEITESGAQISRRAQEVQRGAQTAAASSASGLKAVEDTIQAMDAIRDQAEAVAENIVLLSERTQAIGEIIVTVNDIAERSHLLSLNAAIEAAAAGEHGRTFAIVASEIKSLADQAKEATAQVRSNLSEIQHGINASVMLTEEAVKRVAAGKRQTDASQSTIRDMAENIQESVLAFQQIVAGTNQQQIGLEQVIQALQNIRQASSQTAAGTRQLEDAAGNLNNLGETLVEAVRNYRV